ncbi:MAG: NADH dehydrogenase, partial [Verrucomicrobiales bacterium]
MSDSEIIKESDATAAENPGRKTGKKLQRVVVLGGGFGGLEFCKRLCDPERFHITLIDRQNHHCFQPLLYEVASGGLAAPEIAQPLRSILTNRDDLDVLMDEVHGIYPEEKMVATRTREIKFDYLVIALGVKTGYFGHDDWARHAPGLKSLDDAMAIRRRILLAFEQAEASDNEDEIRKLLTIVVVGGGPTGVELAGSFAELAKRVVSRDFRKIDTTKADIVLIEAGPRLLPMFSKRLSRYTERKLTKMGVRVLTDHAVKDVGENFVAAGNIRIEAANIIWAAGVEAPAMVQNMGAELDRG